MTIKMFMFLANLQNPNQPNWKPVLPEMLLLMLSVLRIDFKRERERVSARHKRQERDEEPKLHKSGRMKKRIRGLGASERDNGAARLKRNSL